jgi:hypothetical protein
MNNSPLDALTVAVATELRVVYDADLTDDDYNEAKDLGWLDERHRPTPAGRIHLRTTGRTDYLESIMIGLDNLARECRRLGKLKSRSKSK